ncbi:hypothetical protein CFP71_31590 [Amycolatopsis thailandensis]|uniref:Uncharacterized protein n=1 Tax=Amycolatopsis thailandensis TaxID=589330 RepID=A0A229RQ39_9PSEU|nr:DUF6401 family natural product biosynthesis protein [Amycolatopsis thailandensis]OXM48788.1 hypothetical protein CFP71_31590 [Amycolatopsis thailandensis]
MKDLVSSWVESSARSTLSRLHQQIGVAGLAAAAALPGLSAVFDQHSAAVRDILAAGVEGSAAVAGVVLLAGYTRGLLDEAKTKGWTFRAPADLAAWNTSDWLTARLVGVCSLAATMDDQRTGPTGNG